MSTCLEADCLSVRCMSSLAEDRAPSDGAAAALFAAGIAARTKGKVIWCLTRPDSFRLWLRLAFSRTASSSSRRQGGTRACFHGGDPFVRGLGAVGQTCPIADDSLPQA